MDQPETQSMEDRHAAAEKRIAAVEAEVRDDARQMASEFVVLHMGRKASALPGGEASKPPF